MPLPLNDSPALYQRPADPLRDLDPMVRSRINGGRNIIPDPFASIRGPLGIGASPKRYATPEQEKDVLGTLSQGAMGSLMWAGLGLDKLTGARALRATHKAFASGELNRDMLSFLPFSDVIGLTDPKDRVWNKDILTEHYGNWKDRPGKIDPVDTLGFVLDVVMDPTLPFTGWFKGGLSTGGKAIKAAGALTDIDSVIARAATAAGKSSGRLVGRGATTVGDAIKMLEKVDAPLASKVSSRMQPHMLSQKVGKSLEFGVPFSTRTTGVNIPGLNRMRDVGFGALRRSPIGKLGNRFFNAKASEMSTWVVQDLAKQVSHIMGRSHEELEPMLRRAMEIGKTGLDNPIETAKFYRAVEDIHGAMSSLSAGDQPVAKFVQEYMQRAGKDRLRYAAGNPLQDEFLRSQDFMHRATRIKDTQPLPPGGMDQSLNAMAADPHRATALRDFVGGTGSIIEIMSHPEIIAASKSSPILATTMTNVEKALRKNGFDRRMPTHLSTGPIGIKTYTPDPEKFKAFVKILKKTDDDVLANGFYKHPMESMIAYARKHRNRMGVASAQVDAIGKAELMASRMSTKASTLHTVALSDVFDTATRGGKAYRNTAMRAHHPFGTKKTAAKINPFSGGLYPEYVNRFGATTQKADLARYKALWDAAPDAPSKYAIETVGTPLYDAIGKLRVDKRIMEDIVRWDLRPQATRAMTDLEKWYDSFTNMFKVGVLTWPARYVRDIVTGQVQNAFLRQWDLASTMDAQRFMTTGMVRNPKVYLAQLPHYKTNPRALTALSKTQADAQLQAFIRSSDFMGLSHTPMAMIGSPRSASTLEGMLDNMPGSAPPFNPKTILNELARAKGSPGAAAAPWNIRGVGFGQAKRTESDFILARFGDIAGEYTDGMNRLAPFFNLTKRGYSPGEAVERIALSQVDYSSKSMTSFEKAAMTRLFPFYKFIRGQLPFVASELMNKPSGLMAQSIRMMSNINKNEEFVPPQIRDTLAVPITGKWGSKDPTRKRYFTGMGLMHEDPLKMIQPAQTWLGSLKGIGREMGGRMSPVIKVPIETTFGEQLYSGRELEDLQPNLGRLLSNVHDTVTGEKSDPVNTSVLLEQALAATIPRMISSGRTLFDPGKGAGAKAMNLLSGAKITDLDYEKSKSVIIREAIAERERNNPFVHALRPRVYVRKEDRDKMDPWDLLLLDVAAQQRINWRTLRESREKGK